MPDCPGLFTLTTVAPDYWDTLVQVAGSNVSVTSGSLTDVTGLTFSAAINALYEIECVLKLRSIDTNGFQFAIACSASGSGGQFLCMSHSSQSIGTARIQANALGVASGLNCITTANTDGIATFKAVVTTVGNIGNITIQCLKTGGVNSGTIYIGSIMKIKQLA